VGVSRHVAALFENIEGDATVNEFPKWFPRVTEQQVRSVLEHAASKNTV
jgi:uncharacterized protein (DUF433 family)